MLLLAGGDVLYYSRVIWGAGERQASSITLVLETLPNLTSILGTSSVLVFLLVVGAVALLRVMAYTGYYPIGRRGKVEIRLVGHSV